MNTTATQNGQQNGPTMWPQVNGALVSGAGPESIGSVSGYLAGLQSPYGVTNPIKQTTQSMDTESMMSGYSERSRKTRPITSTAGNGGNNGLYATMSLSNTPTKTPNGTLNLNSSMTPLTSGSPFAYQPSISQGVTQPINGLVDGTSGQLPFPELYPVPTSMHQQQHQLHLQQQQHQLQSHPQIQQLQQQQQQQQLPHKIESPYSITNRAEMIHIPDVDLYADNATAITGATSEHSVSFDDLRSIGSKSGNKPGDGGGKPRRQWNVWTILPVVLCLAVFLSPIMMVILPRLEQLEIRTKEWTPECDGLLIGFCFKLLILALGCWALFFRRPRASYPRVCQYRAIVMGLLLVLLGTFWLFYSVRIAERRPFVDDDTPTYFAVIQFASSFVDAALFIHYVAVILLEIRQLEPRFVIKMVRSPDGVSQCMALGRCSIQKAAAAILEHYYHQFPHFNRHLERIRERKQRKNSTRQSAMKIYTLDGPDMGISNPMDISPKSILAQNTAANAGKARSLVNGSVVSGRGKDRDTMSQRSGHSGHRSSMDEHEYERRVRKRKFRLISVTEDAFAHIKKMHEARNGPGAPMDPREAAQAIFPSIAKTLQKYLRVTRQHSRHTMQSIVSHLSTCLNFGLSPKAFLERYFSVTPITTSDKCGGESWSIVCDTLLSRPIEQGTVFMLKQGDISLLVSVGDLPAVEFAEEFVDPKQNRFVFKHNSETSV